MPRYHRGMSHQQIGLILVVLGGAVALAGLLVWLGAFQWFGRLPGDIRMEGDGARFYFPVPSMLVISAALSLILYLVRKILS